MYSLVHTQSLPIDGTVSPGTGIIEDYELECGT